MSSTIAKPSAIRAVMPGVVHQRPWRWGTVLVVVVALHWVAGAWFEHYRNTFTSADATRIPVQVALLRPQRIERTPESATPHLAPAPAARASKPRSAGEHVLSAVRPEPKAARAAPAASDAAPASAAADPAANASAAAEPAASASASAASNARTNRAPAAQPAPGVKFSVPPSGDLKYDTFYNGVQNQPGTIHWTSDGQAYEMVVSVPLPFVGTFSYASHGRVDAFGLAPDQYIEKRGRRPEDVTTFNRDAKRIGFTKTPATLALPDGAQDRFSVVMQLASLVRGNPGAYQPGVTREFFVTDNDSGQIWPIEVIGDETVRTRAGFVEARHFMRLPRRDGDRRHIDVWLAPSLGWLPVRILQTEPNGTQFELLWRGGLAASGSDAAQGGEEAPPAISPDESAGGTAGSLYDKH